MLNAWSLQHNRTISKCTYKGTAEQSIKSVYTYLVSKYVSDHHLTLLY